MQETWVLFHGREDPQEEEMQPSPVFLPGKSHGQESLVGDSSRLKEMCLIIWDFYMPLKQNKGFPGGTAAAAAAKSLQSYPTLCDPIDGSPPGSSVPGILQARTLEWVAISFSNGWKWKVKVKSLSPVWLCDPMDHTHQAPPSMGFSRQEYWSGLPLPSPGGTSPRWH